MAARPQGPRQRMAGAAFYEIGPSADDACLRAAQKLIAGEHHQVGTGFQALTSSRLVRQPRRRAVGEPLAAGIQQTPAARP